MMTYLGYGLYRDNEEGRFIMTADESPEEREERLAKQRAITQTTQPRTQTFLQQIQGSLQLIQNGGVNNHADFGIRLRERFNRRRKG